MKRELASEIVVVPAPGEPVRNMSVREWEHFRDEEEAMRIAMRPSVRALRASSYYPHVFHSFPPYAEGQVSRSTIQRLVDKGKLAWVNSVHSAVILTKAETAL